MKTKVDLFAEMLHLRDDKSQPNSSHPGRLLVKHQMQNESEVSFLYWNTNRFYVLKFEGLANIVS